MQEGQRSSIEKMPLPDPAFDRLPDEIISQILHATDPNGFASLILINRKWRAVSQQPHLYAHHLSQCPSYALAHTAPPITDDDNLPRLRGMFARQVKRNLFDAFLRPHATTIKLVSTSISSSSCPGGEGMLYSASPKGHHLLAYNSSRIYVLDVRVPVPKVDRELKVLRRPVSACIKDDGSILAVLSSAMQVDVYDMTQSPPGLDKSIILENAPRTIAMSPGASVLAAAYEGGIEVSSLKQGAAPHEQRSVKCDAVDALTFSYDGTQILGTTTQSQSPSTVILTAPYYDPGSQMITDDESAMWTTSILFPNTSRDCSHAVLLQDGGEEEAAWTFTYDRSFETFRAVSIDDLRNGTTYFTGPLPDSEAQTKLLPSSLPAASYRGELVSAAFQGKDIWVYGVPEDLDATPETCTSTTDSSSPASGLRRRESNHSSLSRNPSNRANDRSNGRVPQWRLLCDKNRNTFVAGAKVSNMPDARNVKWVADYGGENALAERLVITAKGVSSQTRFINEEEDMDFVDGGRVVLLDFAYGLENGSKTEITIELGDGQAEALEEERRSMETEVAIVRRRTVARNRNSQAYLLRAATTSARHLADAPPLPQQGASRQPDDGDDPLLPRRFSRLPERRLDSEAPEVAEQEESASIEEMEAMDAPYAHTAPRSHTTLRRAATAAAVNRTRNPTTADGRPIEYRRADGRREHPHESDADNWVPPPPPYQKDDPGATPAFLSGPSVAPLPTPPVPTTQLRDVDVQPEISREVLEEKPPQDSQEVAPSEAAVHESFESSDHVPQATETARPGLVDDDDIYDVSPPDSPRLPAVDSHHALNNGRVSPGGDTPPSDPAAVALPASRHASQQSTATSVPVPSTPPRQVAPILNLDIPTPSSWETQPSGVSTSSPHDRRITNAQTWPVQQQSLSSAAMGGYPVSAPVGGGSGMQALEFGHLPPAPSSAQVDNLNRRISQGNPRRLSGGMHVQRKPVGGAHGPSSPSRRPITQGFFDQPLPSVRQDVEEPEQPLIISTPTGITGAFDPIQSHPTWPQTRNDGPQIIAPVARHPRPTATSHNRPTVERLETIYSLPPEPHTMQPPPVPQSPAQTTKRSKTPRWLRPRSSPLPQRSASQASRKSQSRAERSAAKNMEDAKKKAWDKKMRKNEEKRKKRANRSTDVASTAQSGAWTDVTTGGGKVREKKCVVM